MRTSFAVIAALFATTAAVKLEQKNSAVGIFSKLMEQESAQNAAEQELKEAREAKRIQLIEAEKEHEKAVAEEDAEEAAKQAKEQEEMEARMEEKKRQDQIKAHEALFKQVMDEQNLQMDERVRIARPKRRHNFDHAADLMLINLSTEEPEEAAAEEDGKKDEAAAAPEAKSADAEEAGNADAAKSKSSDPKKIMADFEASKEKVRLSRKPADIPDPRFTDKDDKMEVEAKPSEKRPAYNSPADVDPYWRAVEGVRSDKMPGSADLAINGKTGDTAGKLPDKAFPKYDYNAQPKKHIRPIKDSRFYDEPLQKAPVELPLFDKSGRLLDEEEAAALKKSQKASSVKKGAVVSNEPEDPTSQDLRDAAKAKMESDALDVKAASSQTKGDVGEGSTGKSSAGSSGVAKSDDPAK